MSDRAPYGSGDTDKWDAWAQRILSLPCVKHTRFIDDCDDCIASRKRLGKEKW